MSEWVDRQNQFGFPPLHFAAQNGNYTILRTLVDKCGADIHRRNRFGASFLHIAAQKD